MTGRCRSRGAALPLVLWLVAIIAVASTAILLSARDALGTAGNRVALERAAWLAEGCANETLGALQDWMNGATDASARWNFLDSAAVSPTLRSCSVRLFPAGMSLNVNITGASYISRTLLAAGVPEATAQTVASSLVDWRDFDDEPRPDGAEAGWYLEARRPEPRNAVFEAPMELRLVRGAEAVPGLDTLLGTEGDKIVLSRAPAAVLAGLPGLDGEAVAAAVGARLEKPFPELAAIALRLSPPSSEAMLSALSTLLLLTTSQPEAWILTVAARAPGHHVDAFIELRLVRDNQRIAIVRRRTWP